VSFDLPSLLIGLIPGMIIGHCTRCRFTCPNGDQGKGGFWCRCNDRAFQDALKPDANFDVSAGALPLVSFPEKAQSVYAPPGRPSCPVCKSDKTKWRPVGWSSGHWHCDKCQNEWGFKI
jgi:hypothetical protein